MRTKKGVISCIEQACSLTLEELHDLHCNLEEQVELVRLLIRWREKMDHSRRKIAAAAAEIERSAANSPVAEE